jgi:hypothetical protein
MIYLLLLFFFLYKKKNTEFNIGVVVEPSLGVALPPLVAVWGWHGHHRI